MITNQTLATKPKGAGRIVVVRFADKWDQFRKSWDEEDRAREQRRMEYQKRQQSLHATA